jgi:F-type H+-transporting ATPase subunit delta
VRGETIARNYASALFDLAERNQALEPYGDAIETVAKLLDENSQFRAFLETPRIAAQDKKAVVRKVFGGALPKPVLNFFLLTIDKRRQKLLREIAHQFHTLVDERLNRVPVEVTLAREPSPELMDRLQKQLSVLLGKTAIPHVRVKPSIVGGVVVRAGDTIYDGSIRNRLERMRRQMLSADLNPRGA